MADVERAGNASTRQIVAQRQLTTIDQWEQLTTELEAQNRALGRGDPAAGVAAD